VRPAAPNWPRHAVDLLAPNIVEAILDGRHLEDMTLAVLMRPFAVGWDAQKSGSLTCGIGAHYNSVHK